MGAVITKDSIIAKLAVLAVIVFEKTVKITGMAAAVTIIPLIKNIHISLGSRRAIAVPVKVRKSIASLAIKAIFFVSALGLKYF